MQKSKPLDPVLLGRPVQVFEALAAVLAQRVSEQLQQTGHRNLAIAMRDAHFAPAQRTPHQAPEQLHIELSRNTVLALMAQRYGFIDQAHDLAGSTATVSATELRITRSLHEAIGRAVQQTLPSTHTTGAGQQWVWQAHIQVGDLPYELLSIGLNPDACASLEHLVAQHRKPLRATPLSPDALQIDVKALLVQKIITAADMQELRVGTVLPIALDRAKVSLNGQIMLSASVTEHQGTLHLTAFETLE